MPFFKNAPDQQEIINFIYAAQTPFEPGNTDKVKAFITRYPLHVDAKDKNGTTALIQSARYGYEETVSILLEGRANPLTCDADGKNAIMLARGAKVAEMLLAAIPDTPMSEVVNAPIKSQTLKAPKNGM